MKRKVKFLLDIMHHSSSWWPITPLQISRSCIFYFGQKDPIKVPILRLFRAPVKICQIPLFPNHKSVFLQILHHSSVSYKINRLYFFSSNNIYFTQKEPGNVKIFGTLECLRQNFSNSSSQFWNDKSIPLQIFHITPL